MIFSLEIKYWYIYLIDVDSRDINDESNQLMTSVFVYSISHITVFF